LEVTVFWTLEVFVEDFRRTTFIFWPPSCGGAMGLASGVDPSLALPSDPSGAVPAPGGSVESLELEPEASVIEAALSWADDAVFDEPSAVSELSGTSVEPFEASNAP
jgi:hypothetical protein